MELSNLLASGHSGNIQAMDMGPILLSFGRCPLLKVMCSDNNPGSREFKGGT